METHSARLALADKLAGAIDHKGSGNGPQSSETPPKQKVRQSEKPASTAPPEPVVRPKNEQATTAVGDSQPRRSHILTVIAAFLAAITTLRFIRKNRKH